MARDASGNFSAGTITANLTGDVTGNATTATTFQTARTVAISGDVTGTATSFNGSANISIASAITANSIVNADINSAAAIADTKLATIATAGKVSNSATTATNANTASAIVARDASGNFSAGTITATTVTGSGNSSFAGNVGIGTSSPTQKLDVVGTGGATVANIRSSDTNASRLSLGSSGRVWSLTNYGSQFVPNNGFAIADETLGAIRLIIQSDGIINAQGNPITNCKTTAKAWVNFNGTGTIGQPQTIRGLSYNVSSVTKLGTGSFRVNYSVAMNDTNYSAVAGGDEGGSLGGVISVIRPATMLTTSLTIETYSPNATIADRSMVSVIVFGN